MFVERLDVLLVVVCLLLLTGSSLRYFFICRLSGRIGFKDFNGSPCLVTVDGTDFRIREQKPFWSGWYSHKFKGPGLRYEVAVSIQSGDIVRVNGPFPFGHWPDIKIFRLDLMHELLEGERVEADKGYRGEPQAVALPGEELENPKRHEEKRTARARHETMNRRLKHWGCLFHVFRHDLRKHARIFQSVAVITQLAIENGEPLFGVDYNP